MYAAFQQIDPTMDSGIDLQREYDAALAVRGFAGYAWVAAVVASMPSIAASRSPERLSKEAMDSSRKLANRLASKLERLSASEPVDGADLPAYLRCKPAQGNGQL
jgi:hypothetical protein